MTVRNSAVSTDHVRIVATISGGLVHQLINPAGQVVNVETAVGPHEGIGSHQIVLFFWIRLVEV